MHLRRITSIFVILAIVMSCLTISATAVSSQNDAFDPETFPSLAEQLQTILSNPNLTPEKREQAIRTYNKITAIKNGEYSSVIE